MNLRTKLIGTLVLAQRCATPVAQAEIPDDRAGLRGPGGIAGLSKPRSRPIRTTAPAHAARERCLGADVQIAMRPDDRAGVRGPGAIDSSAPSARPPGQPRRGARARGRSRPSRRARLDRVRLERRADRWARRAWERHSSSPAASSCSRVSGTRRASPDPPSDDRRRWAYEAPAAVFAHMPAC